MKYFSIWSLDLVPCRAILGAVHGEPGCADDRIIRKLLRTGARNMKGFGVDEDIPNQSPFRGGWFSREPFRQAFVEGQQDCEQRETPACMEMRDAIMDCLSISDQKALNILASEPSKALYRACARKFTKRWTDIVKLWAYMQKRGKGAGGRGAVVWRVAVIADQMVRVKVGETTRRRERNGEILVGKDSRGDLHLIREGESQ